MDFPDANKVLSVKDAGSIQGVAAVELDLQSSWAKHSANPFNWPRKKKWRQFVAGCLVTLLVGMNSTAVATPGTVIANQFDVNTSNPNLDNTVWLITAWNTGAAIGPMVGIPFLEAVGTKNGYLVSRDLDPQTYNLLIKTSRVSILSSSSSLFHKP